MPDVASICLVQLSRRQKGTTVVVVILQFSTPLPVSAAQMPNEKPSRVLGTEENILDRQLNGLQDRNGKGKLGLWTYTTRWDNLVIVLSSITGIAAGAANPLLVVSSPAKSRPRE